MVHKFNIRNFQEKEKIVIFGIEDYRGGMVLFYVGLYTMCILVTTSVLFSVIGGFLLWRLIMVAGPRKRDNQKKEEGTSLSFLESAFEHTRDPKIMEPIREAKKRWYLGIENGEIIPVSLNYVCGHIPLLHATLILKAFWQAAKKPLNEAGDGNSAPAVLLVHGFADTSAGMAYLAEVYHSAGFAVLSIDLRAHGESGRRIRTMGVREAEDVGLWVDWLLGRKDVKSVLVHGISMGGAAALFYGSRNAALPTGVMGIVADSSYGSYEKTLYQLLRKNIPSGFVCWLLLRGLSVVSWLFSGVRLGEMNPAVRLSRIQVPFLLFRGDRDILVDRDLYSETIIVPDAPHIGAWFYAPELYMQKVYELVRRKL